MASLALVRNPLGTPTPSKTDEFSEKFQRGGWGVIFNPKIYVADFCHYRQYFGQEFRKNLQYDFLKVRGDAKAVWNFSENSSVLEEVGFPNPGVLMSTTKTKRCFVG